MAASYDYTMSEILEIDGSVLEGGGQILRISISLSAILGIPVRVTNIRAGRPKPGLAAQHLKGIELVARMCQARLKGVEPGSTEIEFLPGKLEEGTFYADTQTAGSISLLLQAALPCALFAPGTVTLELKGGTNAAMAPQIDYMIKVFEQTLQKFGGNLSFEIIRRGYYPRGGGHVRVTIYPVKNLRAPRIVERGDLEQIVGWSWVAGSMNLLIAKQMMQVAKQVLYRCERDVNINAYKEDRYMARDTAFGILLAAKTSTGCVLGADGLGGRGVDPCMIGHDTAHQLLSTLETGACVDPHAQDQVIIYMALASGQSSVRVGDLTLHTRTAIHVAQLIANVEYKIIPLSKENVIQCNGRGIVNNYV